MRGFAHRQRMQQMGLRRQDVMGKPIVAIINTWSDLSPCHAHLRERAEAVKRGVLQAGGMSFELPALSLGEVMVKPTTMLYRNMLAMEVEELLRSLPIDGTVLLGGCDKTTPGLLMGAISMGLPMLFCPAGPMLNDRHRGLSVGAGTHTRLFWDDYQAGAIDDAEWVALESRMTRSPGHLQHDGHRQHDDGDGRSAGPWPCRAAPASRPWMLRTRAWRPTAAKRIVAMIGRRADAAEDPDPRFVPQRRGRSDGAGRVDQRGGAHHRAGRSRRGSA
jgi:hypothetical protein